ncbi:MAG: NADH-quinone oxidoreductase subunit NuoH [Deltaproteobacteria bacterium]|nr:NADH-quinone oxidoreductase subunit NuoH [Deltaproteobacteria bacterium]
MQALTQYIVSTFGFSSLMADVTAAVMIIIVAALVAIIALTIAGVLTWAERRVAGRTQSRIGPNRVGPIGFLQWMADGVKLITKEDIIPAAADRPLFRLAPYLVVVGVFSAFATIPFGQLLIATDFNVGILYLVAITSLVVVGVLMAGWSSNNKWALLGGIRSAAQVASYEVPSVLSMMSIALLAGSLSLQSIISQQGGWPWQWYIFYNPFTFVCFFLFFTAAVAEGNRTPFDLPEAESELVAGYNVEYSGMRFGGFFLGEFANVYLMSAIATALFFGGWQIPGVKANAQANSILLQGFGAIIFAAKASFGAFVVLWLRWTLPRLRVDQLMSLCYRYLLPLSFTMLAANALYIWLVPEASLAHDIVRIATTVMGFAFVGLFIKRMFYHIRSVGDSISIDLARGQVGVFDPELQVRHYGAFRKKEESK